MSKSAFGGSKTTDRSRSTDQKLRGGNNPWKFTEGNNASALKKEELEVEQKTPKTRLGCGEACKKKT